MDKTDGIFLSTLVLLIICLGLAYRKRKLIVERCCRQLGDHRRLEGELYEMKRKNDELKDTVRDYSNRLAIEMGKKVSADETSVENISIRNRPMVIVDDYQRLCSNEWLDAKSMVDEVMGSTCDEQSKLTFLCNVMQIAEKQLTVFHRKTFELLMERFEVCAGSPQNLPLEITNVIGDYLRNNSDNINVDKFLQDLVAELDKQYSDPASIWMKSKDNREIQTYIRKVICVVWNMVIQRPAMKFEICKNWKGYAYLDLFWASQVEPDNKAQKTMEVVPVFPILYHGKKIMAKGKVMTLKKKEMNPEQVIEMPNLQ